MAEKSNFFTVLAVGDNPIELLSAYDINLKVDKYLAYKYLDASKLKNNTVKILNEVINKSNELNLSYYGVDYLKENLKELKNMSDFEYYSNLTSGMFIDDDGNAWDTTNPNGKWITCNIGDKFSIPFKLKDGTTSYSAKNSDIDWKKMHMNNIGMYESVWDMVMGNKKPETEDEMTMYNNMKNHTYYFSMFKDKEHYVSHNCSYWTYGFVNEDGWVDMDDSKNDMEWIKGYYDRFITKLKQDDKLTIFECSKK